MPTLGTVAEGLRVGQLQAGQSVMTNPQHSGSAHDSDALYPVRTGRSSSDFGRLPTGSNQCDAPAVPILHGGAAANRLFSGSDSCSQHVAVRGQRQRIDMLKGIRTRLSRSSNASRDSKTERLPTGEDKQHDEGYARCDRGRSWLCRNPSVFRQCRPQLSSNHRTPPVVV